jgi:hypothetical protein
MLEQASSLISSVTSWGFSGCKRVPLEVHEDRLHICANCEFKKDEKCGVCGCFLKPKTSWITEKCPLGKWSEYDPTRLTPN